MSQLSTVLRRGGLKPQPVGIAGRWTAKQNRIGAATQRTRIQWKKPAVQCSRGKVAARQSPARHLHGSPSSSSSWFCRSLCPSKPFPFSFSLFVFSAVPCQSPHLITFQPGGWSHSLNPAIGPSCHSQKPNWWFTSACDKIKQVSRCRFSGNQVS